MPRLASTGTSHDHVPSTDSDDSPLPSFDRSADSRSSDDRVLTSTLASSDGDTDSFTRGGDIDALLLSGMIHAGVSPATVRALPTPQPKAASAPTLPSLTPAAVVATIPPTRPAPNSKERVVSVQKPPLVVAPNPQVALSLFLDTMDDPAGALGNSKPPPSALTAQPASRAQDLDALISSALAGLTSVAPNPQAPIPRIPSRRQSSAEVNTAAVTCPGSGSSRSGTASPTPSTALPAPGSGSGVFRMGRRHSNNTLEIVAPSSGNLDVLLSDVLSAQQSRSAPHSGSGPANTVMGGSGVQHLPAPMASRGLVSPPGSHDGSGTGSSFPRRRSTVAGSAGAPDLDSLFKSVLEFGK
jgi:hypothetical protein